MGDWYLIFKHFGYHTQSHTICNKKLLSEVCISNIFKEEFILGFW